MRHPLFRCCLLPDKKQTVTVPTFASKRRAVVCVPGVPTHTVEVFLELPELLLQLARDLSSTHGAFLLVLIF